MAMRRSIIKNSNDLYRMTCNRTIMSTYFESTPHIQYSRRVASLYDITKRYGSTIDESSWAVEGLKKQGEKVAPASKVMKYFNDDTISKPEPKIDMLVNEVLALNVVEIHQFLNILQKRLGITDDQIHAKAGMGGSMGGAAADSGAAKAAEAPVVEKTAFDLKLTVVDAKAKIKVIKEVRTITGLGLKEAKELVEKAPVMIKQGLKKDEVENFKKILVDAGAQVEVL